MVSTEGSSMHSRERRLSHVETNPPPQSEVLVKCPHCDRNFAKDRVDRHVEVRLYKLWPVPELESLTKITA